MTIKITEGSYYITRDNTLAGPMEVSMPGNVEIGSPWHVEGLGLYRADGRFGYGKFYYTHLDITQTVDDACRRIVEGV